MYRGRMFTEKALEIFRRYVETRHGNNMSSASRELGVHITTLEKWLKGTRDPGLGNIGPCMDIIGVQLLVPGEEEDQPPSPSQSPATCSAEVARLRARIMELEREVETTRTERDKAIGQVELLKEQLATESAKKDVASAERVSSSTRGSTRAG